MRKIDNRNSKKIRNLIVGATLSAIVLGTSTYAWFIGMKTVNVSSFDVEVAASKSLFLSLDGKKWSNTVEISKDNFNTASYTGNTNSWGGRGLMPMSTIGEMDKTASRMKLFEKASLTTTPGGYRLLASRVNNYTKYTSDDVVPVVSFDPEREGYVTFDLFVHNFSGTQYLENLDYKDEEDIYLTTDSAVTVASTGVGNTGIENSVRVAFAQIGRVAGTETDQDKITGITCNDYLDNGTAPDKSVNVKNGVTGICRKAQIWEPNDKHHVDSAISWYKKSCLTRKSTGTDVTADASFNTTACGNVTEGNNYPTYAVKDDIKSSNNVDIYDGTSYNGYTGSGSYLEAYNYFKDSDKILTGTSRPTFMKLAPNSITKIRIYVYIEGQDIDNYDFAQIGKKIAVKFGLTKERYTQEDIGYNGPEIVTPTE